MVRFLNKSIGILGGSFDPAHIGHLKISKIAIKKIKLSKVLWVVTKQNPFKHKTFYSLSQRITKAKKYVKHHKKIQVVYLDEAIRSSNSIDILNYLIKAKQLRSIYFIIGSDNLIKFHKWKNWKRIVKLTKLVVFSRRGYDKKSRESIVVKYLNKKNIIYINNKLIDISSSNIKKNYYNKF